MPEIGRNDPCPCGSGKKYKHCCMEKEREEKMAKYTDAWEVDVTDWTLDDLCDLEDAVAGLQDPGRRHNELRNFLGHLVTNKTSEEIGKLKLPEFNEKLGALMATLNEMTKTPKQNATP